MRRAAMQVLDQIADNSATNNEVHAALVKVALARLEDPAGSVREAALRALGHLAARADAPKQPGLAVAMAPHLADSDPHVRAAAEKAMQRATDELDRKLLPELLFFESPTVRRRAEGLLEGKRASRSSDRQALHA